MSEPASTEQPMPAQEEKLDFGPAFQTFYVELKKELDLTFAGLSELDQEEEDLVTQVKSQLEEKQKRNAQLEKRIESVNAAITRYVNGVNATNQD